MMSAFFLLDRMCLRESSDPTQCRQRGHEEVLAPAKHVEGLDAVDATPYRRLRNGERRVVWLQADDRVALVAGPDEIAVVDPLLLQEFNGGHRLGTDEQEMRSARHFVGCLRQCVWIVRGAIRCPPPYDAMDID